MEKHKAIDFESQLKEMAKKYYQSLEYVDNLKQQLSDLLLKITNLESVILNLKANYKIKLKLIKDVSNFSQIFLSK